MKMLQLSAPFPGHNTSNMPDDCYSGANVWYIISKGHRVTPPSCMICCPDCGVSDMSYVR